MSTQNEIIESFKKQMALIHDALINNNNNLAILATDNLLVYLQVKTKELGEGSKNENI